MVLKTTVDTMKKQIEEICRSLDKAMRGNKAASQRVRTTTLKFAKLSKLYRKESVAAEKKISKPNLKKKSKKR